MADIPVNQARRSFLLGATAALGGAGVIGASLPFILSWKPSARARALGGPTKVNLSKIAQGEVKVVEWRRKPVYVVRQHPEILALLSDRPERLADPMSLRSDQPEYSQNPHRSSREDITVLIGLCTHLGCAPATVLNAESQAFDPQWQGGFFCPCHGSKFDAVGRVYRNVPAPTNLAVPEHYFADENTLIIGASPPA